MKKAVALVLSLVLMLGLASTAMAKTAESLIPTLEPILKQNENDAVSYALTYDETADMLVLVATFKSADYTTAKKAGSALFTTVFDALGQVATNLQTLLKDTSSGCIVMLVTNDNEPMCIYVNGSKIWSW